MDNDFVEEKVCYKDEDCHQLNDRFLSKCVKYKDCGHLKNPFRQIFRAYILLKDVKNFANNS
jgi:hypothetical protein